MENQGKKLGLLVGCNYPNTPNELQGCINDVIAMRELILSRFGFDPSHVQVLTDEPRSEVKPTGANIMKALNKMVREAEEGDILFFHFSGHGTLIPSLTPYHPRRKDEAIVPCDFNLITDVDFRNLVNNLPKGATLTILSDSCHSGGLIAQEKEQIGPSTNRKNMIKSSPRSLKFKFIPLESVIQHLSLHSHINTNDIGTHLLELFGSEASLKFLSPRHESQIDTDVKYRPDGAILLSGCEKNETSADLRPKSGFDVVKACGAFSNAVQMVLKDRQGPITNKEIVRLAREVLREHRLMQHPCLYCSDANADTNFLS